MGRYMSPTHKYKDEKLRSMKFVIVFMHHQFSHLDWPSIEQFALDFFGEIEYKNISNHNCISAQ